MNDVVLTIAVLTGLIACGFLYFSLRIFRQKTAQHKQLYDRNERLKVKSAVEIADDFQREIEILEAKCTSGQLHLANLREALIQATQLTQKIACGLLPPVFKFDDSERLKEQIAKSHEHKFKLIKNGLATKAYSSWSWFGDETKGKQLTDSYQSLLLKAYNAEFEFIRKQMRYSTYETALSKLQRLGEQLAALGETAKVSITAEYAILQEKELFIWYGELVHKAKIKEEKKQQQALLRAQHKSGDPDTDEIEDQLFVQESMLKKAKKIALAQTGGDPAAMDRQINAIRKEIDNLNQQFERAQSQAQITKAGYIYVISNIGSFGEGIVKIGMTRRLEPLDRVNELGDASVPFRFDVHTLAFVENAPSIEKQLHQKFNECRVNTDNPRKEFFKVSLKQVKDEFEALGIESDWYFTVDAKEYRESLLIRSSLAKQVSTQSVPSQAFPEII